MINSKWFNKHPITVDLSGAHIVEYRQVKVEDAYYYLPEYALHRPATRCFIEGKYYEPFTHYFVEKFCNHFPGSIVHAGTFFGDMLPSFSNAVSGAIYAFEPALENYVLAKICVDKNNLSNVQLYNCALGSTLGNVHINTGGETHAGGGSAVGHTGELCSSITIDSFLINDLTLLQLDVEGYELEALNGSLSTLQRNRPVVAIEDNLSNCNDFLRAANYELFRSIPGLKIWIPNEKINYMNFIAGIFS